VDGGVDQGGGQGGAQAVLVGAAGGPEEARVALAGVGAEDELDQAVALVGAGEGVVRM
jgi:hypothetical protein